VESLVDADFWRRKAVLVTGHTGFKGGWLAAWLHLLGARVIGYALPPPTNPSLFEVADVQSLIESHIADLRDYARLQQVVTETKPDIIFHLAAQPLVLASYEDPIETYSSNVLGTAHVLECARKTESVRAVVVVTSDKCYENRGWVWGYREDDRLGGNDPYSNSKACSELVAHSYRASFFSRQSDAQVASVRAGNVIGGGDWGLYRLIPDLVRAITSGEPIVLRHADAIRPWQFVLDPLHGYILLAERLHRGATGAAAAWNFGPDIVELRSVAHVVEAFKQQWDNGLEVVASGGEKRPEERILMLDSTKARIDLGWRPLLDFAEAIEWTVDWYKAWKQAPESARQSTMNQLQRFMARARGEAAT
jgi:CDP-glucose 4,6-dehydratase